MDKYEYNIKADQIMKLIDRRDFKTAAKIADGIDWRRVRNINMLTNVGCVYQAVGRYTDAKNVFQLALNRAPLGRRLVYQMADICIDSGEFEEAEHYIQEFSELAPKDTGRFELLYQLSRRKGEPIENQIAILEEFKKQDFDERWAYELAKLYHKAGYNQKCIAACDELILWFGEGQYVEKAMELKMLHVPLSPSQQEKYNLQLKKKQEEEATSIYKKQKETIPASQPQSSYYDGYNTENLQAALAKSMQEIMEAEERNKATYPSGLSYLEEYQSEQEEREAMFAATRDLRREREKFKNMMTQPISSLITEMNSDDKAMQNMLIQQYSDEKVGTFEEEEARSVFGVAFGRDKETEEYFESERESIESSYNVSEETEEHLEPEKEDDESAYTMPEEERILTGRHSDFRWEETGTIFGTGKKEKDIQQSELRNVAEENIQQPMLGDAVPDSFEEPSEEETEEDWEEDTEETLKEELESKEMEEENDNDSEFLEENFLGEEFYYQVPEMQKEEPEYIEVPFSLNQLDTSEMPAEIYYRIPSYNPQSYLDKAANKIQEIFWNEKKDEKQEEFENDSEQMEDQEKFKNDLEQIEESEEFENDLEQVKELTKSQNNSEGGKEDFEGMEKQEELEEELEIREEYLQNDFEEEDDLDYDEYPEGGTEEDFYLYIMTRNYGMDELPEDVYYQVSSDKRKQSAENIEKNSHVPSEPEEQEDLDYIYGEEMLPKDAYYVVPGYDPESFFAARAANQGLEEEILEKNPQMRIQKETSKKKEPREKKEKVSEKKSNKKTENASVNEPQGELSEESILELPSEYKNVFVNYLHMPGVEQQIAKVLYETEQNGEELETSFSGNILIMGEVKSGKTTLAVSLIKTMNRLNGRKGRKVAKISGARLNNKGIQESISRLAGADLIIEHAGEMRVSTITELLKAMGEYTGGMIIVLEDTKTSIERLLADIPQIATYFTNQIELKECNIAEWAEAAKNYAMENHYMVDDMAMLALSAKIDEVYANKKNIVMEDVQDIIDDAIERAERRNKKLLGRIFSKKKDSDSVLLKESDFS